MITPTKEQQKALNFFKTLNSKRFYLGFKMGQGKTFTSLWNFKQFNINSFMIVSKSSLLKQWIKSVKLVFPNCEIVLLDKPKNEDTLLLNNNYSKENTIYLMSYDKLTKFVDKMKFWNVKYPKNQIKNLNIILDEAQILKAHNTNISKSFLYLNKHLNFLQLLSGSIISNSLHQLYTQWTLLNYKEKEKVQSYYSWIQEYFNIEQSRFSHFLVGNVKEDKKQELMNTFNKFAYFIDNDFENITIDYIDVKSKEQFKMDWKTLREKVVMYDNSIKLLDTPLIVSLTYRMMLSGFNYTYPLNDDWKDKIESFFTDNPTGRVNSSLTPLSNERITERFYTPKHQMLKDVLNLSNGENFLIFHSFIAEIEDIETICNDLGYKCFKINGESNEKQEALDYQGKKVIIAQYEASSQGIDGLQFDFWNIIHYSLTYSYEKYSQSNGRLYRMNQKHNVKVYHLINSTVEEKILENLKLGKTYNQLLFTKEVIKNLKK